MEAYLSDSGQNVIVILADGEAEEFTVEEFVATYGEDALPVKDDLSKPSTQLDVYYRAFRKLCLACGKYAWAKKLKENVADGIYPTQKVAYEVFGGSKGDTNTNLEIEIDRASRAQYSAANDLNFWSQAVGFKPMSDKDIKVLVKKLYDEPFRSRLRYRVDKYWKKRELISARDLVIEVMQSLKKSNKPS